MIRAPYDLIRLLQHQKHIQLLNLKNGMSSHGLAVIVNRNVRKICGPIVRWKQKSQIMMMNFSDVNCLRKIVSKRTRKL